MTEDEITGMTRDEFAEWLSSAGFAEIERAGEIVRRRLKRPDADEDDIARSEVFVSVASARLAAFRRRKTGAFVSWLKTELPKKLLFWFQLYLVAGKACGFGPWRHLSWTVTFLPFIADIASAVALSVFAVFRRK